MIPSCKLSAPERFDWKGGERKRTYIQIDLRIVGSVMQTGDKFGARCSITDTNLGMEFTTLKAARAAVETAVRRALGKKAAWAV